MKKSGYRTVFHIYLIFFLSLLGTILAAIGLFMLLITIGKPNGETVRSDWPSTFTEDLKEQIIFIDDKPQLKQAGLELLRDNQIGLQILDDAGNEIHGFQTTEDSVTHYEISDLLQLAKKGYSNSETVSYTHLDVYKRQLYFFWLHLDILQFIIFIFILFFPTPKIILMIR